MWLSRAIARASRSDRSRISRRSSGGQAGRRDELLDGHVPVQHLVARPPDPTHPALTERREEPVSVSDELGQRVRHRPDGTRSRRRSHRRHATVRRRSIRGAYAGGMSAEEPLFRVVRGSPTAEELAALVGAIVVRSRPAAATRAGRRVRLGAQRPARRSDARRRPRRVAGVRPAPLTFPVRITAARRPCTPAGRPVCAGAGLPTSPDEPLTSLRETAQ